MADEEDAVREQLIDNGDAESGETGDDNGKPIGNAAFGNRHIIDCHRSHLAVGDFHEGFLYGFLIGVYRHNSRYAIDFARVTVDLAAQLTQMSNVDGGDAGGTDEWRPDDVEEDDDSNSGDSGEEAEEEEEEEDEDESVRPSWIDEKNIISGKRRRVATVAAAPHADVCSAETSSAGP